MEKNRQLVKLFIVLFLGTAFIFSFSLFGAKAFVKISNQNQLFSTGTSIGDLDISGKTKEEAVRLLEEQFVSWKEDSTIELSYGEETAKLDITDFQLDAVKTINSISDGQKNTASINMAQEQLKEQLQTLFPSVEVSEFDVSKLTNTINSAASLFEHGTNHYDLFADFLVSNHKETEIISESAIKLSEMPIELQALVDQNPEIEIKGNSPFSLLEFSNSQKVTDKTTLNVLATGIYETIIQTNFTINERNISDSLPSYAVLGSEASISSNNHSDLVLTNPNKSSYILGLEVIDNELKVTLKGEKLPYTYKIVKKEEQKVNFKTIIQYSPILSSGEIKLVTKGQEGKFVKVYREVYQGESYIKTEKISDDFYPPQYQVEIHSLSTGQGTVTTVDNGSAENSNEDISTNPASDVSDAAKDNSESKPSDQHPADSSDSNLWGKTNEEPK